MSKLIPGEVVTLLVDREEEYGYFLKSDNSKDRVLLHNNEIQGEINIGDEVEVFIFQDKDGRLSATMTIPHIQLGVYGWGVVEGYRKNLGAFVNIGISKDILVSVDDLPLVYDVWPKVKDQLYITLRHDKNGRLFGKLATEEIIRDICVPAPENMYNKRVKGFVYKTKKVGSYR